MGVATEWELVTHSRGFRMDEPPDPQRPHHLCVPTFQMGRWRCSSCSGRRRQSWVPASHPPSWGGSCGPCARAADTYKADASVPAWHQGAHVGGAAEASHHSHVELLQDLGRWPVRAQTAPAHGHAPNTFAHALVLGRQPGHLHVGIEGGHPIELQRRVVGYEAVTGEWRRATAVTLGPGSPAEALPLSRGV